MLTSNDLGNLHLDPDFIQDDLEINYTFAWQAMEYGLSPEVSEFPADRIEEDGFTLREAVSASHYRQAASHSLLLTDLARRNDLFGDAARTYGNMDLPYAFNMAAFTDEQFPIELSQSILETDESEHAEDRTTFRPVEVQAQYVYMLLANLDPKYTDNLRDSIPNERIVELRQALEDYRRVPVGILGIPVSNYLDLVDAINPSLFKREVSLDAALFPFITQFDEAIKQTIEDDFHWQQLAFELHPAEPDVFGVLVRILSILKRREQRERLFGLIGRLPLARPTEILLRGILADY
jgi:hypothetical protein